MGGCLRRQVPAPPAGGSVASEAAGPEARGSVASAAPGLRLVRTKGDLLLQTDTEDEQEFLQVTLEAERRSRTATAEVDLSWTESDWLVSSRHPGGGSTPTRCSGSSQWVYTAVSE